MPKTEVILTHNVVGLGAESDHVKVAAGYARNFNDTDFILVQIIIPPILRQE